MSTKKFSLLGGLIMLVMGALAFITVLSQNITFLPDLQVNASYGLFLGYFPMNVFNKVALILFGLWGIWAAQAATVTPAISYSRTVCILMGVLAIIGLFPMTNTLFGYWPLFGGEVLAHGAFAILGGYFGYVVPARATSRQLHA